MGALQQHPNSNQQCRCDFPTMSTTNVVQWTWVGATRRHTLRLHHHTLSGKQELWLNNVSLYSSGWRFKLTGTIQIPTDDSNLELYLLADGAWLACARWRAGRQTLRRSWFHHPAGGLPSRSFFSH